MTGGASKTATGIIVISVILALALSVMSLPPEIELARPPWLPMLAVYWVLRRPESFGLIAAWVCGILLDALQGTFLGQHALALTIVAALAQRFRLRMRVSPISHQTASVALLAALYEFLLMWVDGLAGQPTGGFVRFTSAATVLALWPLLALVSSTRVATTASDS